jgi:5-formyltetrahydrofolate cyclo-ligase
MPVSYQSNFLASLQCSYTSIPYCREKLQGLAFDRNGWRIGHGRGYYDRFLEECDAYNKVNGNSTATIALALSSQILDSDVPRDEYDRKPNTVLTP